MNAAKVNIEKRAVFFILTFQIIEKVFTLPQNDNKFYEYTNYHEHKS